MFIISLGDFITKEHAFSVKKKKKNLYQIFNFFSSGPKLLLQLLCLSSVKWPSLVKNRIN